MNTNGTTRERIYSSEVERTDHKYIVRVEGILSREPIIDGTRTPVRRIVEMWRMGLAPEQIPSHLPYLNMAQVFDALSYFSDYKEEILYHIERNRIPNELIDPLVRDM